MKRLGTFIYDLKEHERNIRIGNLNNALQHISQSNHIFDFNSAKFFAYIYKRLRQIFEDGAISFCNSLNNRTGFYNISPYLSKSILNHHHHVLVAQISLTLSHHFSLSFIASGRSSGLHPVSSHSCWMYVRAGRPAFVRPYVGVHKSTSLMSSSLLLQQCPACLVRLTWIVFVIGGRWPYSWCLVGCYRQDLFKIARSILV